MGVTLAPHWQEGQARMTKLLRPITSTLDTAFVADRLLAVLIRGLLQSGFTLLAHPLVRWVRHKNGDEPISGGDDTPAHNKAEPIGPFRPIGRKPVGDLLIFCPRSLESYLIDEATGRYGYSHVGVDCGEKDQATGKRVFVEATPHVGVHRSNLDKYGPREFIRIPLDRAGIDVRKFRECVLDKLGEPYDMKEVFTWAQVDDPAKQVCSDLAANCLPAETRRSIVGRARTGRLGRHMVSIHGPAALPLHIFVSPNGFAKYFGAPKGHKISKPDELVLPRARGGGFSLGRAFWAVAAGAALAALVVVVARRWQASRPYNSDQTP
jgi:hypothetical protein